MINKQESLHAAYIKFAEDKDQKAYEEFLFNFFMFAKERCNVHIPIEIYGQDQMNYGLVHTTDGYYFVVCTDAEELCKCPEEVSGVIPLDKIVDLMANDDEVRGICVNPYGLFPCFIPQEYARRLLRADNE